MSAFHAAGQLAVTRRAQLGLRHGAPSLKHFFTSSSSFANPVLRKPISSNAGLQQSQTLRSYSSSRIARPPTSFYSSYRSFLTRCPRILRNTRSFASKPSRPNPTPHLGSPEPALSLSARLKILSKEYGWSALGVYIMLSIVDFPFCFLFVHALGAERVGRYEHAVVEAVKNAFYSIVPSMRPEPAVPGVGESVEDATMREGTAGSQSLEQLQSTALAGKATIWTQLALAYAIHKSFIFIRVPLTAAVTPKVVRYLRAWGWEVGKKAS
ncbi:hypothetical protein K402DRAFT_392248 [Aulographum hederae CBS 113979]|uniref:DUF1279 domain-containing protein n=1 Tax=Aulographum hederae CBS 113979 TaxID=1176131 RepID=A0A6G1H4I4_9PEZI|nr:hypothetical protein K402DRAFT_392248 [Aulographum hederae CBS 113979]